MSDSSLFRGLERRHVVRVALAYAAGGWLVLPLASLVLPTFGAPASLDRAWKQRDPGVSNLLSDALLRPYRDDRRLVAFCRKVGLPMPGAPQSGVVAASRS